MIPLNKPGQLVSASKNFDFFRQHFPQRNTYIVSTASDALNVIYRKLYEEMGALRVGVSPMVCFQAIYPIVSNGHTPVFLDIDPDTFNLNISKLSKANDIQALQVIHLGGNPNEMDAIRRFAETREIPIIEDCAQALGSTYADRYLGNFSDFAAFSMIKNIHTPYGGLLVSQMDISPDIDNAPLMSNLLRQYRRVKIKLEGRANHRPVNFWNYLYGGFMGLKGNSGTSFNKRIQRLNEDDSKYILQQLGGFEFLLERRLRNAQRIIQEIDTKKAKVQDIPKNGTSNRNRILLKLANCEADKAISALRQMGIAANNFTQNYKIGFQPHISNDRLLGRYYQERLEDYESVFPHILAIPSSPFLLDKEIEHIIIHLNKILL